MIAIERIDLLGLVGRDVQLKKASSIHGGEYAGPCPFCGGSDRFRLWPAHESGRGQFWCRQCDAKGDAIDYVRKRDNADYRQACQILGIDPGERVPAQSRPAMTQPLAPQTSISDPVDPPVEEWQARAWEFVTWAQMQLWTDTGADALAYLRRRGLTDDTIERAMLGYNPKVLKDDPAKWMIGDDRPIYLADGIVIPNWSESVANLGQMRETLWGIRFRRLDPEARPKYLSVKASTPALYGADMVTRDRPVVLVEGELDALTIAQEVPEVAAVATGSTAWCRRLRWIAILTRAPFVIVAYDTDDAGEKAAAYWLDVLGDKAKRWRPWWDDANAMQQAGANLRSWLDPIITTQNSHALHDSTSDKVPA